MSNRPFFKNLLAASITAMFLAYSSQLYANFTPSPIKFLLTFDDGPSGSRGRNPTAEILDALDQNSVQPGIKAIFFLQTRATLGSGTETAQLLMYREQADGHLLAFHTSTPGHANHRLMAPEQFELSLKDGIEDITAVSGVAPQLVRPPFWNYDARTLDGYHRHGLQMLLTDLSANDGVVWGMNWNLRKRSNLFESLRLAEIDWADGKMPSVDGSTPIVVTFHDVNSRTARNIESYLKDLLQMAQELKIPVAAKPFYDNRAELERAALARSVNDTSIEVHLPGIWNWFWK